MVLVRKTENEIDRQLRYFLEEKLEGILKEAQKTRKRRQELFGTKKIKKMEQIRKTQTVHEKRFN
ncbi:hypothetical protein LEP1GSC123_1418 [Leptospira borgpetersenii str. 200701203]|uniref:Uncharacterized protein n=1 Tax=Leptospira borgpetersenii str. 200701203 TaxID=1193007 RepID=M3HQ63_LEPBO|nr:hypothetical protein LEP1GSC123_1418 [Leptospira borgpetersenii str. 200701203]